MAGSDDDDELKHETDAFSRTMRAALGNVMPKASEIITMYAAKLGEATGQQPAAFVGVLIQMHSQVWADFCDAVSNAYIEERTRGLLGVTTLARCSSCGALYPGGERCPMCPAKPH